MSLQEKQLENLLGALALSVNDAVAEGLTAAEGLYGSDAFALVLLQQGQQLRSDRLARQLSLAQSSAVRLVDRLQRAGLVQRQAGTDRRTVWLSLTAQGVMKVERILAARQRVLAGLVEVLSPGEREAFHGIADKLLTALTLDTAKGERNCRLCDEGACDLTRCPVERRCLTFEGA